MSICELCDDEKATIECAVCDQQLCAGCDAGKQGSSERERLAARARSQSHNGHHDLPAHRCLCALDVVLQTCTSP